MKPESWPPKSTVDELMKLAGVPDNADNRRALCVQLKGSKVVYYFQTVGRPFSRKPFAQVAKAARALSTAMNALNYIPQTNIRRQWMDDQKGAQAEVFRIRTIAEKRAAGARRGQPRKFNKVAVVYRALAYLNGGEGPTKRRLSNKHREFVELFYEAITGETDVRGSLEWQIRQARRWKTHRWQSYF